jgi:hypothetical protein
MRVILGTMYSVASGLTICAAESAGLIGRAFLRVATALKFRSSSVLAGGLALLALASVPSQARTPYDGLWSVSLKVDQGSCGSREIEVLIRDGEISHAGDRGFFTAEGRVAERGRIEVSIGAFGMTASADGQLSEGGQGSGVWQFPERGCSGQWLAERRST